MKSALVSAIMLSLALGAACSPSAISQDANPTAQPAQNPAQAPGGGQGQRSGRGGWAAGMGGGRGVLGTVTEVAADHYTIKTDTGELYTVHFSANTRIMKAPAQMRRRGEEAGGEGQQGGPQPLKPTDIKVGDAITAGGEVDAAAKSVGAVFILQIDPERAKQMRDMQANYGKTWIMGKVTAVDGVKVTIQGGPDNATHTFTADENTTFRKRRDPITLADVQVGDMVRVEGGAKDGGFIAASVAVMGMQGPPPGAPVGLPPPGQPAPQPK